MARSPFFGIGITSASFHELGKEPQDRDRFKMKVSCSIRSFNIDLRTVLFICLSPDDFVHLCP